MIGAKKAKTQVKERRVLILVDETPDTRLENLPFSTTDETISISMSAYDKENNPASGLP